MMCWTKIFPSLVLAFITTFSLMAGVLPQQAEAASAAEINNRVQGALQEFHSQVKGSEEVLAKAKGVLIFPRVYQGGIGFGGEYGEGALLVGGKTVDYYNIASLSWGLQLGGQIKSIIIAFMTDDALRNFRQSQGWEIGGDASVAVITLGAEKSVDVTKLNQPIIGFVVDQKGLMYNLTLEGSKITRIQK